MKGIEAKFAPREIFEQILEWSVIPTFDLIIEYGSKGVIVAKRKIAPYKSQWALPGLRMFKGENIDNVLDRIAKQEIGLRLQSERVLMNQYVGKFSTEHNRQDISTCYLVKAPSNQEISLNKDHFSNYRIVTSLDQLPSPMGTMYKVYLKEFFSKKMN